MKQVSATDACMSYSWLTTEMGERMRHRLLVTAVSAAALLSVADFSIAATPPGVFGTPQSVEKSVSPFKCYARNSYSNISPLGAGGRYYALHQDPCGHWFLAQSADGLTYSVSKTPFGSDPESSGFATSVTTDETGFYALMQKPIARNGRGNYAGVQVWKYTFANQTWQSLLDLGARYRADHGYGSILASSGKWIAVFTKFVNNRGRLVQAGTVEGDTPGPHDAFRNATLASARVALVRTSNEYWLAYERTGKPQQVLTNFKHGQWQHRVSAPSRPSLSLVGGVGRGRFAYVAYTTHCSRVCGDVIVRRYSATASSVVLHATDHTYDKRIVLTSDGSVCIVDPALGEDHVLGTLCNRNTSGWTRTLSSIKGAGLGSTPINSSGIDLFYTSKHGSGSDFKVPVSFT